MHTTSRLNRNTSTVTSRAAAAAILVILIGYPAWAQDNAGQDSPLSPEQLQRRVLELEQQNQDLKQHNQELERANRRLRPKAKKAPEPVDIREVYPDEAGYDFLGLGTDVDYLKAERFRIADQIESFIPPLYEPVRPFHAYTLPPGAWRIKLSSQVQRNDADFGRDGSYASLFSGVDVRSQKTVLSIQHGLELANVPDLTLALDVPFRSVQVSGSGVPFPGATMTMSGSGDGLGDISLTLKKKWLDQGNDGFNFATFIGVILPTGKDDVQFNSNQVLTTGMGPMPGPPLNIFGRNPADRLLPPALQPGQGAWGFRVGGAVTRQLKRGAIHGGIIADFFEDNDGITPGDEYKYGVSYVVPPFDSDQWAIDLSLFGRYKEDSEFPGVGILGPRSDFEHGFVMFFSPSVIFTPNPQIRFIVSPEIRIIEPDRGPSPEFGLTTSMTFTF